MVLDRIKKNDTIRFRLLPNSSLEVRSATRNIRQYMTSRIGVAAALRRRTGGYMTTLFAVWCYNYNEQWIIDNRLFKTYEKADDFLRSIERDRLTTAHYNIEELYLEE